MMYRATTPEHIWELPFSTGEIEKIEITYQQGGKNVLIKTQKDCTLTEREIRVLLTQEETLLFASDAAERVLVQLKIKTKAGKVWATDVYTLSVYGCLNEGVM